VLIPSRPTGCLPICATGVPVSASAVTVGNANYVHKQSFTLSGFSAGALPEIVELTIRRIYNDTFQGDVTLVGLRLSYQAVR